MNRLEGKREDMGGHERLNEWKKKRLRKERKKGERE